jgi:hypothetical protein
LPPGLRTSGEDGGEGREANMKKLFREVSYDVHFLRGHTLQPAWFKVLKVFLLLGAIFGFVLLFGWRKAVVFAAVFLLLMLIVHLVYRVNTRKFTRNWLDFIVVEDQEKNLKQGIGLVYYTLIILNAVIGFAASWVLV